MIANSTPQERTLKEIPVEGFPEDAAVSNKLLFLLNYAVLAPSPHNTQPWLFSVRANHVELYADRRRSLHVIDPNDRELTISCGAALFMLRLAMRHFGYEDKTVLFPNRRKPDLLARISLGERIEASQEEHELFYAILKRRTNRKPFFPRGVSKATILTLEEAAKLEGAWLRAMRSREDRNALSVLVYEGTVQQWQDKQFRAELAAWLHPNRSLEPDGIPGYAMGMGDLMSRLAPTVTRAFNMGVRQGERDQELLDNSPVLAVLGTEEDNPEEWLKAGQALARVLLCATSKGLSASFLNQPVEIVGLRAVLADILDTEGFPQVVLRLGYGPEVGITPRRDVNDCTMIRA